MTKSTWRLKTLTFNNFSMNRLFLSIFHIHPGVSHDFLPHNVAVFSFLSKIADSIIICHKFSI